MAARPTNAVRQRQRDDANANKLCRAGCGHLSRLHLELDRADPRYKPLDFYCRVDDCGCHFRLDW